MKAWQIDMIRKDIEESRGAGLDVLAESLEQELEERDVLIAGLKAAHALQAYAGLVNPELAKYRDDENKARKLIQGDIEKGTKCE